MLLRRSTGGGGESRSSRRRVGEGGRTAEKETEVGRDGEQVSSSDDSKDQQGEFGSENATHEDASEWGLGYGKRGPLFFATARFILSLGVIVLQERRMTVLVDI
jgi:hypothetical protein